jgi:hypothetical protein
MLECCVLVAVGRSKLQGKDSRNLVLCGKSTFQMAQLQLGAVNNKILLLCSQLQGKHSQLFVTTTEFITAASYQVFLSKV